MHCLSLIIRSSSGKGLTLDRLVGQLTETLLHAGLLISLVIIAVKQVLHIVVALPAIAYASVRMVRLLHIVGRGVSRLASGLQRLGKERIFIGIRTSTISLIASARIASTARKDKMLSSHILPAMMVLVKFMSGWTWINRLDVDIQGRYRLLLLLNQIGLIAEDRLLFLELVTRRQFCLEDSVAGRLKN